MIQPLTDTEQAEAESVRGRCPADRRFESAAVICNRDMYVFAVLAAGNAHIAGVGMLEYYERRTTGKHLDASRLFLYKVTRELQGTKGDDGAQLRDVMKAMVLFGVPDSKR